MSAAIVSGRTRRRPRPDPFRAGGRHGAPDAAGAVATDVAVTVVFIFSSKQRAITRLPTRLSRRDEAPVYQPALQIQHLDGNARRRALAGRRICPPFQDARTGTQRRALRTTMMQAWREPLPHAPGRYRHRPGTPAITGPNMVQGV